MGSNVQNDPGSIKNEFIRIVRDFSQYLACQKETGNIFPGISEKSQDIINNWGGKINARQAFLHEGPENAPVFILDSETGFFKGDSGKLLTKILMAMNLTPDAVFICNAAAPESVRKKIKSVSPKVIITLGTDACQSLLNIRQPFEKIQGKFHEFCGIKVMPTFHPSLLLKQPEYKRQVWEDMKKVIKYAGLNNGS
ncbi:MAG: hypothetical protein GXP56_09165 [Deltaproteobacteria bacterium]|nr:hypothetical protein [Deltaproteobacteria bacterium]